MALEFTTASLTWPGCLANYGTRETQQMKLALIVAALLAWRMPVGARKTGPASRSRMAALGTWSGHGNMQTDSFNIEGSQWRVKWATTNEKPAGAGSFRARWFTVR